MARFYQASSPALVFNLVARQVAAAQNRSLSENARALALLNMASNDSLVASFWMKYHYTLWRPETAIFEGSSDGNRKTAWNSAGFVPQWIEADLGASSQLTSLVLVVNQHPAGQTTHEVWVSNERIGAQH